MMTYNDFKNLSQKGIGEACVEAISRHKQTKTYITAIDADAYDRQQNTTINNYVKVIYSLSGNKLVDFTATNNKISSNFFRKLNVQRNSYLLGNGTFFNKEDTKAKLGGDDFDTVLKKASYFSLIHGVSFLYWNYDSLYFFKLTEFVPLYDEKTGLLMAGIRFWQIDYNKPLNFTLYEIDGYTQFYSEDGVIVQEGSKKPFKTIVKQTEADGELLTIGENYLSLPIIPLYGSDLKQSTLVGMKEAIDSYDLIRSGFANDLSDCSQVYWILENYGGMTDEDLSRFRDKLLLNHIAEADTSNGGSIKPYAQEIPFQARSKYLETIRANIYEDFSALDTSSISASAKTATEIRSAYQSLDDVIDDFEYEIIQSVQNLLKLIGIDDTPTFKRNKIANELETVQMVIMEAPYLDEETILKKLPNISVDEIDTILKNKQKEESSILERTITYNNEKGE